MDYQNKIQHVGVLTNNPSRLINFYTKHLGFSIEKESSAPKSIMQKIFGLPCDCKMTLLACGYARLELFWNKSYHFKKRINSQSGFNHFSFLVEDKEKFCKALAKKKVPVIKIAKAGRFVYFIKDPDGNRIEVQELLKAG